MITRQMLAALQSARCYDLGQPLRVGMPTHPDQTPFTFSLVRRHGDVVRSDGCSACNDLLIMSGHTGTHLDSLGHISVDGRLYGDGRAADLMGTEGLRELGMETVPPLLLRGLLFDMPSHRGVPCLSAGEAVTAADMEACSRRFGLDVRAGDAVLVRTGWIRHWDQRERFIGVTGGAPGVDLSAAEWMIERGVRLAGSDTIAFEVIRSDSDPKGPLPVHPRLLTKAGVGIIEMLNLEELARDQVREFLFIVCPLKIVGGTGSPVRPVAIPIAVADDSAPAGP